MPIRVPICTYLYGPTQAVAALVLGLDVDEYVVSTGSLGSISI